MSEIEFEAVGTAIDKYTDIGTLLVYRCVGGSALFLCSSEHSTLPVDPQLDTRDRSGSGFARTLGSEPTFETGEYTHYKGGVYDVDGLALRTDTVEDDEWWVVYRTHDADQYYARPLGGFTDTVTVPQGMVQRFRKTNTAHE